MNGVYMLFTGVLIIFAAVFISSQPDTAKSRENRRSNFSLGLMLLTLGLLCAGYFYFVFDSSVETESKQRISNLGLISDRQNGILIGLVTCIVGVIFYATSTVTKANANALHVSETNDGVNEDTYECPRCAEIIKRKAKICRFCKSEVWTYV